MIPGQTRLEMPQRMVTHGCLYRLLKYLFRPTSRRVQTLSFYAQTCIIDYSRDTQITQPIFLRSNTYPQLIIQNAT